MPDTAENKELMQKFKDICWRERKSSSKLIHQAIKEFTLNHQEGNNSFKLTDFIENADMVATPTLGKSNQDIIKFLDIVWDSEPRKQSVKQYITNWVDAWNETEKIKCQ